MQGKRLCLFIAGLTAAIATQAIEEPAVASDEPMALAGKFAFFDKNLSSPPGQSCASCHDPAVGWTSPNAGINKGGAVFPGVHHEKGRVFGVRKPPSSGYATVSPLFAFDPEEGIFVGGNFWDGRATGWLLGNPAADQASGPFLNPVEQHNTMEGVCEAVAKSNYADLFAVAFGEPIDCSGPEAVQNSYYRIATAIAVYEDSGEVNQFSSRFDDYWRACLAAGGSDEQCADGELGNVGGFLTAEEWAGFDVFYEADAGNCAACHPAPLFTDFTYDNLGVPKNPENPIYAIVPAFVDSGLGRFLARLAIDDSWRTQPFVTASMLALSASELEAMSLENRGKHKVPTLRNVAMRPGRGFTKSFTHNGAFKSLLEVVHFYNTRDIAQCAVIGGTPFVDCWPEAEVSANVNDEELGNLGLSTEEELLLVKFLETLTDRNRVLPPQATGK
jgi:cytochrome c peroxidase